ncbi:FAD-dependent monooxygenase [Dactylosporangium salmoneum]|uniref:Monooxygenase n=1 Tax=Dactylosporangium salmoneum TaxID=53361 RepID=A0ABP5UUA7_9ACTN
MSDPVVIAGGGPAGMLLACELGLAGVDTVVLERDTEICTDETSKAHALHARAVEALDLRGLMEEIRNEKYPIWPMIHYANFWLDLSEILDEEYSLLAPQAKTQRVLEDRAVELGVDVRRGHRLVGLAQDEDGVTVTVLGGDGEYTLRGSYLVGCDGAHSTVRELAGFSAPAAGMSWYAVFADFDAFETEFESPTYPEGIVAVVPHPSGPVRMMTMEFGAEAPGDDVPVTVEELRARAAHITGQEFDTPQPRWMGRAGNVTRLAERYRVGRVLLAGDAAHVHYFGAGHGLNTSMQDAMNLGWKLAGVVHGWAPGHLLDTYHKERHPVGERACVSSQAQLALQYPPDRVEPLREIFGELVKFPDVNKYLVRVVTDVAYPFKYLGRRRADAHPLQGRPVPHVSVETAAGPVEVASTLHTGRGVVLDLTGGKAPFGDLSGWAGRVDVVTARPSDELGAAVVLVRPDGFVAWADATGDDAEGLRLAITHWFGTAEKEIA